MVSTFYASSRRSWLIDIISLSVGLILFYTLFLGHYAFFTPDEGRYAEVAREMVASGDYITPRVNGVAFLDKPILYYWLQTTAIHLFGVKEWALRLFPALFGVFGCLMTYLCGRRLFDRRTGLLSAIILATSPLYFGCAHYANLDLEVAVLISSALLCLLTAIQRPDQYRSYFLIAAYFFSGLAILTKGLIGIVFPGMILGTWIILNWRWRILSNIHLGFGLLLMAVITLPWYALAQQANPDFLHYFFVTQHFTRFLSGADFNNKLPVWFYLPVVFVGFLPWTLFSVQTLYHHLRAIWRSSQTQQTESFLLLWCLLIFIFFSIPHSKLVSYILPVFPPLALLTGRYLSLQWRQTIRRLFYLFTTLSIIGLLTLVGNAQHFNKYSIKPLLTSLKSQLHPQDKIVAYFRYFQDAPLYLERRLIIVADWHDPQIAMKDNWVREFWYGIPFQPTDEWLIDETTFWQQWRSQQRIFVLVSENYFEQFKKQAHIFYIVGKYNNVLLICNQRIT